MESKKIELTRDQFFRMLKLVYLGRWMVNSHRDEPDKSMEDIEQYMYSAATIFGYDSMVEFDQSYKKFFPSAELEETMDTIIQEYDDYTFWDELAWRMAERDFTQKFDHAQVLCMTSEEIFREKNVLADKYFQEFSTNGIDNLSLLK